METSDRLLMAMAKGLLEEAGLTSSVTGEEICMLPGMVDAVFHRMCRISVSQDLESEAREVLPQLSPHDLTGDSGE